jgi:hypothetical protein
MNTRELAKMALLEEAKSKPNEKIKVGNRMIPYSEFSKLLISGDKTASGLIDTMADLLKDKSLREMLIKQLGLQDKV